MLETMPNAVSAEAGTLNATPSLRGLSVARAETQRVCALELVVNVLRRNEQYADSGEFTKMFADPADLMLAYVRHGGGMRPAVTSEDDYVQRGWNTFYQAVRDQLGADLKVDLSNAIVYAFHRQNNTLVTFERGGAMLLVEPGNRVDFDRIEAVDPLCRGSATPHDLAIELFESIVAKGTHLRERRGIGATFRNLARRFDEDALSLDPELRDPAEYAERAHDLLHTARERGILIKVDLLSDRVLVLNPHSSEFGVYGSDGRTLAYLFRQSVDWRKLFGVTVA